MTTKRKKLPVGRPRSGLNVMIAIRWPQWLLDGIDQYGRSHMLDRPSALRHLVTTALAERKLVDPNALYLNHEQHGAR